MIAPCLLSGYLWRRYWVRFRALGRDESDQPSAFAYLPINNCGECHHGLFALRRHCPVLSADSGRRFRPARHRGGLQYGERRSEEHTSELQSLRHFVCPLLLEQKKLASTCFRSRIDTL